MLLLDCGVFVDINYKSIGDDGLHERTVEAGECRYENEYGPC
jgi:hypothetical protein